MTQRHSSRCLSQNRFRLFPCMRRDLSKSHLGGNRLDSWEFSGSRGRAQTEERRHFGGERGLYRETLSCSELKGTDLLLV